MIENTEHARKLTEKIQLYLETFATNTLENMLANVETLQRQKRAEEHDIYTIFAIRKILQNRQHTPTEKYDFEKIFFSPLTPFLTHHKLRKKYPGQIFQQCLTPILTWVIRDIFEPSQRELIEKINLGKLINKEDILTEISRLRTIFVHEAEIIIEKATGNEAQNQKLTGQLGNELAVQEMQDIMCIFRHENMLEIFKSRLPENITTGHLDESSLVLKAVKDMLKKNPELASHIGILCNARAQDKAIMIGLAQAITNSTRTAITSNPTIIGFLQAIFIELENLAEQVQKLSQNQTDCQNLIITIQEFHKTHQTCAATLALSEHSQSSEWMQYIRNRIANILIEETNNIPGLINRALKISQDEKQDTDAIETAKRALIIFMAIDRARESLALNNHVGSQKKIITQALEISTDNTISKLRQSETHQQDKAIKRATNAITLCEIFFGQEYAATLQRNMQAIINKPIENSEPIRQKQAV